MKSYLEKIFIVEGIILGIIGILFFINPLESLFSLTTIIGVMLIVSGVMRIFRMWKNEWKFLYLALGLIDILFGIILISYPIETIENLILFIGIWSLIRGIYNLVISIKFGSLGFNVNTVLNILTIIFGLIITFYPFMSLFLLPYVPYIIGIYFIAIAAFEIYVGFKL